VTLTRHPVNVYENVPYFAPEIPKDEEFLEAVISAMRSLLQMIASKNIPQVQNMSPFKSSTTCG